MKRSTRQRSVHRAAPAKYRNADNNDDNWNQESASRGRCGKCDACRRADCGRCTSCRGKVKFGGDGRSKQSCVYRKCHVLHAGSKKKSLGLDADELNDYDNYPPPLSPVTKTKNVASRTKAVTTKASKGSMVVASRFDDDGEAFTSRYAAAENILFGGKQPADYLLMREQPSSKKPRLGKVCLSGPGSEQPTTRPSTLHGLVTPHPPPPNVCAACQHAAAPDSNLFNNEDDPPVALLCDGPNCGREYHMVCCVPPMVRIPSGDWYCVDCSPQGTSKDLKEYLDSCDQARARYASPKLYHFALRQEDWQRVASIAAVASNSPSAMDLGGRRSVTRGKNNLTSPNPGKMISANELPPSELLLSRVERVHFAALSDPEHPPSRPLATRAAASMSSPTTLSPSKAQSSTSSENAAPTASMGPSFFVGKPVRLFEPTNDMYHTGRIVDYKFQTPAMGITLYLIRFSAGTEGRKRTVYHWLDLEEHDLAIGTTLIWASIHSVWQPSLVWLRTTRSIMFQESEDVWMSNSAGGSTAGSFASSSTLSPRRRSGELGDYKRPVYHPSHQSSRREKVMAWVKPFDPNMDFTYMDVKTQAKAFVPDAPGSDSVASTNHDKYIAANNRNERRRINILSLAATAEWKEQKQIATWRKFLNGGPRATMLAYRDENLLKPLLAIPPNAGTYFAQSGWVETCQRLLTAHTERCPLISQGLDRNYVLQLMERQGVKPSHALATTLSCQIISVITDWRQTNHAESGQ